MRSNAEYVPISLILIACLELNAAPWWLVTAPGVALIAGRLYHAKGMSQIARDAGLGRENLYKALSAEGNPEFATIMKVIAALGLQLHASPSSTAA